MYLRILIEMDNAAFGEDGFEAAAEVSRILQSYSATHLKDGEFDTTFQDINGNKVGGAILVDGACYE